MKDRELSISNEIHYYLIINILLPIEVLLDIWAVSVTGCKLCYSTPSCHDTVTQ